MALGSAGVKGVFVVGMHRSGTSAAARLVNLLGIPTCVEEDLLLTTADNPRGYWESATLTGLNDRLLDALGCDWTCPVELTAGWEADLALEERGSGDAAIGPPGAELRERDGVERAGCDGVAQTERTKTSIELAGGLAREGEGEHVARIDDACGAAVGDASGEHPRLAGAGAGEDAQR